MTNNTTANDNIEAKTGRRCAMCKNEARFKFKPFCSKRCADLDLGKWLNGSYMVSEPIERYEDE